MSHILGDTGDEWMSHHHGTWRTEGNEGCHGSNEGASDGKPVHPGWDDSCRGGCSWYSVN